MTKLRLVFNVEEETLINSQFMVQKSMIDHITKVLANIHNSENDVILVTAGAIASGMELLGKQTYSKSLAEKQALAAIGQVRLIQRYQNNFDEYTQMCAQVLLTRDIFNNPKQQYNAKNTFKKLSSLGVIPIINENDTISTADIEMENNYTLTETVANIISAHALIQINKNLSFNVLPKGYDYSFYCQDADALFKCVADMNSNHMPLRTTAYPSVFPTEQKVYE